MTSDRGHEVSSATPEALDLYRRVLRGRPRTRAEITAMAPSGVDVTPVVQTLEAAGLLVLDGDDVDLRNPRAAVAELIGHQWATRRRAWSGAAAAAEVLPALTRSWRRNPRTGTAVPGSVTVGDGMSWWRSALGLPGLRDLAVLSLRDRPTAIDVEDLRLLVPVRELRDEAARTWLESSGADVRVTAQVAGWLAIGETAALALRWRESHPTGATVTGDPSIVAALEWVFNQAWQDAIPVGQLDVLVLLGLGCEDAEVAAVLGTSVRTVQRRIGVAMDRYGARSRFDLGVAWATDAALQDGQVVAGRPCRQ